MAKGIIPNKEYKMAVVSLSARARTVKVRSTQNENTLGFQRRC